MSKKQEDNWDIFDLDYAPIAGAVLGGAAGKRIMRKSIKNDSRRAGYARAQSDMAKKSGNSAAAKDQDWVADYYKSQARRKGAQAIGYGAAAGYAAGYGADQEVKKRRK